MLPTLASNPWGLVSLNLFGQISLAEIIPTCNLNLNYIHILWPMEKPFTFFNLHLSNYDMREDILFDSENYNIYENVMAFIVPNSNAFPTFQPFY